MMLVLYPREQERKESDQRIQFLCQLPPEVFTTIYYDNFDVWAGTTWEGVYYSEYEIYTASLERNEGYEVLL